MLETTGFVRRVDEMGRMVLPKELRRLLGIAAGDSVEIWIDGDQVVLVRHIEACVFCGGQLDLMLFKGKRVCRPCRRDASSGAAP